MKTSGAARHKPSGLRRACFSTWLPGDASPPWRRSMIAVDDGGEGPPGKSPEHQTTTGRGAMRA